MPKQRGFFRACNFLKLLSVIWLLSSVLSACKTSKQPTYFSDLTKDTVLHNLVTKDFQLKIRRGDVLGIGVTSLSAEGSTLFTAPQAATESAVTPGYLVDQTGNILFPKLGNVTVEGLTRDELKNRLMKDLLPYLKDPVVTVAFLNHKITIIGDVGGQQVLPMTGESLTILDALAKSGGVSKTGRSDNILLIREEGTDKQFKRLSLNNSAIFSSPYYYLRPDDILYVETDPKKSTENNSTQKLIGYVTAGISFLFIIIDRIVK
jgi:polysaccharide export outer membrane protein